MIQSITRYGACLGILALAVGSVLAAERVPGQGQRGSAMTMPASVEGADAMLLTFESPEFILGPLDGQQGWTTEWTGEDWVISDANPYTGSQHLRSQVRFEDMSSAAFGPTLMGVGTAAYSIASTRIAIDNQGSGSDAIFSAVSAVANDYNPGGPLAVTRVRVRPNGTIDALQPDAGFVPTSGTITDTGYHEIKVIADNSGKGTIEICLDGASIFTGSNIAAQTASTAYIDSIRLQASMPGGSLGSTADFDDMRITDSDRGGCADPAAWNFDGVSAPDSFPTGWTADVDGAGTPWITQTESVDSAPNAAYAAEHEQAGEANLYSAQASIGAVGGRLAFRHRWNVESGFDGGVVELSIAGGAYADVIAAGGSFVEAGYNGTLDDPSNPLGVRPAWTGQQVDFVTTTIELPLATAGQDVRFRWRLGSNASAAAAAPNGWWVDSVTVSDNALPTQPSAVVAPESISLTIEQGATATQMLSIANAGGGTLTYHIPSLEPAAAIGLPYRAPTTTATPGSRTFSASHGVADGLRGAAIAAGADSGFDIAQMSDHAPVAANAVSCGAPDTSTDQNSWWRRFYFGEHPLVGATARVDSVTIASESGPAIPATINLYTTPHADGEESITPAALTLIGTGTATVGGVFTITPVAVDGIIDDTVGKDLVVEYRIEGSEDGEFFPGGNASAQSHPTYISAPACGQVFPVDASLIGRPDFHLVMLVHLQDTTLPEECSDAAAMPWLSATPSTGALGFGAATEVALGFDAGTLAAGTHEATMCVTTNDADHAVVLVPLSLQVDPSAEYIFADGFEKN